MVTALAAKHGVHHAMVGTLSGADATTGYSRLGSRQQIRSNSFTLVECSLEYLGNLADCSRLTS